MVNPSETLIDLARAALAAEVEATSVPYTEAGWRPWREAAETFQTAVTEEAASVRTARYELEMAAKQAARESAGSAE